MLDWVKRQMATSGYVIGSSYNLFIPHSEEKKILINKQAKAALK